MKSNRLYGFTLFGCLVALSATSAEAGIFRRGHAAPRCAPPSCGAAAQCAPCATIGGHYEDRVVTNTIYVPTSVTETRKVVECVMKPETRERSYTVTKRVPYTETLTQEYVVMVQKTQMRKVTQTVYKPVTKEVTQAFTVMVPHQEMRQGVRQVPVCEPVTYTRTVCVDRGHWETRTIQVPCVGYGYGYGYRRGCGGCGSCGSCAPPPMTTQCIRVWVPSIVHEQVQQTVLQTKLVPQNYQYAVTVCKPEQRTRTVQVCETVAEQVTREVPETICVPEKRTRTYDVTKYKCVNETKSEQYTVMVPTKVEREVQVQVCRMVPKEVQQTIRVWVPGCAVPVEAPAVEAPAAKEPPTALPTPAPKKNAPAAKPAVL